MKRLNQLLFPILLLLANSILIAQAQYTPYDDCPGLIKSYKPAYQDDYPVWAKMLYQYPVNYDEVTETYSQSNKNKTEFRTINRYYKQWTRHLQQWVNQEGVIELPDLETYYQAQKEAQLAVYKQTTTNNKTLSNWTFLGPKETFWLNESGAVQAPKAAPWQVNIYSFDVSNSDPNTVYCGTETGFVNKTIDQGNIWSIVGKGYNFGGGVTATAINPTDPNIVYVAAGNQVHKTMDGGEIWTPLLDNNDLFNADRLVIDPTNTNKIVAASSKGVFVSTDAGQTWQHPWTTPTYDVQIKMEDSMIIFALTKSSNNFAMITSVDGGISFQNDNNFPSNINESSGGLLAATLADPNILVTILLSTNNTPLLYKKTINTNTWELLATGQTNDFPLDNGQGYFDLALGISPSNAEVIFVGTSTLYKSADGGQTFSIIGGYGGDFAIHPDIQDIKILADGEAWVATDGGMSYTNDYFTNTNNYTAKIDGIIGSDMWGFDQGWNEDIIVGGRYHNGNTAIADFYQPKALRMGGAESPTGWVLQGKSRHVAFNDLGNGWILPKTAESAPEGRFIFSKYPNMDEYGGRRGNMVFHPNYYGTIYLGEGDGFWKSTDSGVNFDLLHDFNARILYLQISYSNPNIIYADIVNQGLFRSNDGGYTWEARPALTNSNNGGNYWKGKTFFAISPSNENVIYACLQNGTWSNDIGSVFKSIDGGNTWENWTGSLDVYTKNLVVQPDADGNDIVYLFSSGRSGTKARVFKRGEGMTDWETFENDYPAGMSVNMALPFYRDSKLRVAGNAGVWESSMEEVDFQPIINPWVEKAQYDCLLDTLYFDDHSILNHENTTWHWTITPTPAYLEDANIRNPKVVLGSPQSYDVTLEVTKNGETYTKSISNMVDATTCPSIDDCSNPARVPKNNWSLLYVDSEETNFPGLATMSFDDDPSTIWHTRWSTGSDPYPHEIQIDMGEVYGVFEFEYLARSNGPNGRIKDYELYFSESIADWGDPIIGNFVNTAAPQKVAFEEPIIGRYFRLVALSEVNDNAWTSAAEFNVKGCRNFTGIKEQIGESKHLKAFPIPSTGRVKIVLPFKGSFQFTFLSSQGRIMEKGRIENALDHHFFDLGNYISGIYFIKLKDEAGRIYRVKLVKE